MIYTVDFRADNRGGAVVPGELIEGDFDSLRMASKVTFLTHGFNVDRAAGADKLHRLAAQLGLEGAVVLLLWPGDSALGAVSYPFEGRDADDTADYLVQFIDLNIDPSAQLSFFAHSLGARVVMECIGQLRDLGYRFGETCLVAAAIDDFSVSDLQLYRHVVDSTARVTVLASREDKVLKYAYPAGDLLQTFFFFWREHFGMALGYHGPRPGSDGSPVPDKIFHEQTPSDSQVDHGHYLPDGSGPATRPGRNQRAVARFAGAALSGAPAPGFKP